MTEYTPTTDEFMRGFRIIPDERTGETLIQPLTRRQKERWLEAHDREVAAQALRETIKTWTTHHDDGSVEVTKKMWYGKEGLALLNKKGDNPE